MQAQKVPLRPPPFLQHAHTHTLQKREDARDPIMACSRIGLSGGGGTAMEGWEARGVKCHSLTERGSSALSEKGQMADVEDEYLSNVLIKIRETAT